MKKICMILFIGVFLALGVFSGCKKKLPTQPDIPTKVLPTIEYFHATPEAISLGEVSILSWSVKNATNITINQDVGTVSAKATTEVRPEETTTYTLTAINSDGQKTQSCKIVILELPVIEYFTASPESIMLGEYSALNWSVTNADTLTIDPLGDLTIPWEGGHMVSPTETTTYTLIAINDDGETTASCTVEIKKWAVLEFSTIPESPSFYYYEVESCTYSDFTVVLTEIAGVGGQINGFLIVTGNPEHSETFLGGTFSPFEALFRDCSSIIPGRPDWMIISIGGVDNNGYMIELYYYFNIYWAQSTGTMRFLKIVEGASHHKLIN